MTATPLELPTITRHTVPVLLQCWYCHSFASLQADIGWQDASKETVLADLSLGGWRGHDLARQWGSQLGLPPPPQLQPELYRPQDPQHYADTVGQLIDHESEGDQNFIAACQFARQLVAAMLQQGRFLLGVIAPFAGQHWNSEDLQLLRIVASACQQYRLQLALWLRPGAELPLLAGFHCQLQPQSATPPALPPTCALVSAVPGLLHPDWLDPELHQNTEILELAGGQLLLSPLLRPLHPAATPAIKLPDHLQVSFALRQQPQDCQFLQQQADQRFAEGGYQLAYTILDQIDTNSLPLQQQALLEVQKQKIAIALLDFPRAATGMLPDASLPDEVQAALYQNKAWGLVMTGQAHSAEQYFARARQLLDPVRQARLYLYLQNISALNQLRLGDVDAALALEKTIEQQLQRLPEPDWHLCYINCLNQARIYKKLQDYAQAEHYYRLGFAVNGQLRNESDLLYMNLCLAQLKMLQQQPQQALYYWLRTAIHWLSNPLPEALAPRVAQAVLGQPLSNRQACPEQISASLLASAQQCTKQLGIIVSSYPEPLPFARISQPGQAQQCIGIPGFSLLLSLQYQAHFPVDGPAYRSLNQWTLGLLQQLLPELELTTARSILTDPQCGHELPVTARETLWSCLQWQVPSLQFAGQAFAVPLAETATSTKPDIAAPALITLLSSFKVQPSTAISYVSHSSQGWHVIYKRYRPALSLNAAQQQLLLRVQQPCAVTELGQWLQQTPAQVLPWLYQLSQQRLIQVH
jgi:tetratricopeptide (TPR) repeat protein